ncbi:MAG: response regulator [Pyrinomonadaceae bacterium]
MRPQPRVLCAEPSADICSLLRALLDINGFDSDSASTVSEAVGKAEGGEHCLFIVDDGYRDGTNVELIRRLRALKPHVPVLVYSSLSFEESRRDTARAGAVSYIVKPGEFDRLVEAVVRLCGAV